MSDAFLEEQLRRIRQLTERMAKMTDHDAFARTAREHYVYHGPLHEVRDVRIVDSVPPRKPAASDEPPRRQRRRRR